MEGIPLLKTIGRVTAGLILLTWPGLAPAGGLEEAQAGLAAQRRGDHAGAVIKFTRAIDSGQLAPTNLALAHVNRGNSLGRLGKTSAAVQDLERAIELAPDHPAGYNSLAWLLATCPRGRYRNGARAVELARVALKLGGRDWRPVHLDTLAAALAEAGSPAEAVAVQEEALGLMKREAQPPEVLAGAGERLESYRRGRAWREETGSRAQPPGR